MRQTFEISLNEKYRNELTKLDSGMLDDYGFPQLIVTIAHELAHCLLGDFFRICGYAGTYTHRIEHRGLEKEIKEYLWNTKEIKLLLPLQINLIQEKIFYYEGKLEHLQKEEEEIIFPTVGSQEFESRRSKRDEIRDIAKYLAELQVNKEKLEERFEKGFS